MLVVQFAGPRLASLSAVLPFGGGVAPRPTSRAGGVSNFLTVLRGEASALSPTASRNSQELTESLPDAGEGSQAQGPAEPPVTLSNVGNIGAPAPRVTPRAVGVSNLLTVLRSAAGALSSTASLRSQKLIESLPDAGEGSPATIPAEPKPVTESGKTASSLMPPPVQVFQFDAPPSPGREAGQPQQQYTGGSTNLLLSLASPPILSAEGVPGTIPDTPPAHSSASGQLRTNSKQNSSQGEIKTTMVWSPAPVVLAAVPTPLPLALSFGFRTIPYAERQDKLPNSVEFNGAEGSSSSAHLGRSAVNLTNEAHLAPRPTALSAGRSDSEREVQVAPRETLAFRATLTPLEQFENLPVRAGVSSVAATNGISALSASSPVGRPAAQRTDASGPKVIDANGPKMTPEETPIPATNEPADLAENRQTKSASPTEPDSKKPVASADSVVSIPGQILEGAVVATPDRNTTLREDQPTASSPPSAKPESKSEINTSSQPQPTREISVKVSHTEMPNVDIRLSDRGGKILVSVRSESPELAQSLRSDLGELVGRLEHRGYQAETSVPTPGNSAVHLPSSNQARDASDSDTAGNQSRQQNQQESRRRAQPQLDSPTFSLEEVSHHDHELT